MTSLRKTSVHVHPNPVGGSRAGRIEGRFEALDGEPEMRESVEAECGTRLRGRVAQQRRSRPRQPREEDRRAATCLARDGARLMSRYGVLTPAAAMGMRFVERLRNVGMTFDIHAA